jgi:hypothetical protein
MNELAKILVLGGIILLALGLCLSVAGKIPWLGRLPGDIVIKKGGSTFYFPLATCILLSIIISLIIHLWNQK